MDSWVDVLTEEYEQGRRGLNHMRDSLGDSLHDKQDKKKINSMINDMSHAIDWMKNSRNPDKLRGIDKKGAYQRRVLMDMELFPSLDIKPHERELTDNEKNAVYDVISLLSARQRQCFILHTAYNRSMAEISLELGIKKATVQMHINRAKNKINNEIHCHTKVI